MNQSAVHKVSERDAPQFFSLLLCAAIVLHLHIIVLKKNLIYEADGIPAIQLLSSCETSATKQISNNQKQVADKKRILNH